MRSDRILRIAVWCSTSRKCDQPAWLTGFGIGIHGERFESRCGCFASA